MNTTTAHKQSTPFHVQCTVANIDNIPYIMCNLLVRADIAPSASELDETIELADNAGQFVKQEIAKTALEHGDQRATELAQQAAPHLHKNGKRPFTFLTPYGDIEVQRQRLCDPNTNETIIPSATLWNTSQNRHIVSALAESACEESQKISFRDAKDKLSKTAKVDSLLSHSTVWNLKQKEEQRLEKAQDLLVEHVLEEHRETLDKHGFLPPPSSNASDEVTKEIFGENIEEEADALYTHFTSECRKNESDSDENNNNVGIETTGDDTGNNKAKRVPRHVPADTILIQADEVLTKSQEPAHKVNKTHTATVETGWGRVEYLAARSSEKLQLLVAVVLVLLGLFSGKKLKLEVISDGAAWIRLWVARFVDIEVYHLLCWYHLCKRVCAGLSGLGTSADERKLLQKEILGHLWKGDVDGAVAVLKSLLPRCRVKTRVEDLIDYLIRKRSWIGDYEGRHAAGLWIASTRVEKWNDVAVSERCKHRGMSWKETGVLAMAMHAANVKRNAAKNAPRETEKHTTP